MQLVLSQGNVVKINRFLMIICDFMDPADDLVTGPFWLSANRSA